MTNNLNTIKANERSRTMYFDILRIMATFFVVVLHVSAGNWSGTDINSFEWQMMNLFDGVSRWGVPIFVMISGALFLNRKITMKQLYGKYVLRLVLSFIVWSSVYAVLWYVIKDRSMVNFITSFIKGNYHLWFIYMIIGLYIITPMLNKIVSDEKLLQYYLILSFVFAIIIPEVISIIKTFNVKYGDWAESVIDQAHLHFVLGFSFYYVLGYYISKTIITKKQSIIIYIVGIVGFLSTVIFSSALSKYKGEAVQIFYSNMSVNVVLESISVFVLFKNLFSNISISKRKSRFICTLSKYSFGAYLVHALIITLLKEKLGLSSVSFNTLIAIPVISAVVFITAYLISAMLNHVPFVKKYFV